MITLIVVDDPTVLVCDYTALTWSFAVVGCKKKMEIVSEISFGTNVAAANALSDDVSDLFDFTITKANYWLGPQHSTMGEFVIDVGCTAIIRGVSIRNGKNHFKNSGTKKFSIYLALHAEGPWKKC